MKTLKLITLSFILCLTSGCRAQEQDRQAIKKVITLFSKAGDNNDAKEMVNYLDDNYRITMNRLFGSETISIMSRSTYLAKIESKEYGGDTRSLNFEHIIINGNTAIAKVVFSGQKMTFDSLITLVKDGDDHWKLIADVPIIK